MFLSSEEGFLTSEDGLLSSEELLPAEDEGLLTELLLPDVSELLFLSLFEEPVFDVLPEPPPVSLVFESAEASDVCDTAEDDGLSDVPEALFLISELLPFFLHAASSAHTASKENTVKNNFFIFLFPYNGFIINSKKAFAAVFKKFAGPSNKNISIKAFYIVFGRPLTGSNPVRGRHICD